jgi:hypothetical protein
MQTNHTTRSNSEIYSIYSDASFPSVTTPDLIQVIRFVSDAEHEALALELEGRI